MIDDTCIILLLVTCHNQTVFDIKSCNKIFKMVFILENEKDNMRRKSSQETRNQRKSAKEGDNVIESCWGKINYKK